MRIAVAPALNFSGSPDFDPNAVADLMASELSCVDGVKVLPVSRTLAVLAQQGLDEVESPEHALAIRDRLGADAILVFAVTEYNPYDPPVVGITAQLYGWLPKRLPRRVDPVLASRSASPLVYSEEYSPDAPIAQASRVFNAANVAVVEELKEFAAARGADNGAFGWRKYVVSQQHYLRFCCHATITEIVKSGTARAVAAGSDPTGRMP